MTEINSIPQQTNNSHIGTLTMRIRPSITMGDVRGKCEKNTIIVELGWVIIRFKKTIHIIKGNITGKASWLRFESSVADAPTAANSDA